METVPQQEKLEEEKERVKQREDAEEEDEEEEEVKHTISTPSPPPAAMGSPPPSSSTHQPSTHNNDDSDSPPHPIDSPTNSSLSSGHSSASHLSSPRDQAPQAERNPPTLSPPLPVVSVKRSVRDGPPPMAAMVAKVDPATVDGPIMREWPEEAPNISMASGGGRVGRGGDSPTNSSLSSGHSSASHLSSPRDQAPQAERNPPTLSPPLPVVSVKRSVRDGPPPMAATVAKVDPATVDGPIMREWPEEAPNISMASGGGRVGRGGGGGAGAGAGAGRRLRPDLSILRRARRESMVRRAQLVSRVCGCVFCLVAFSVMAADKDQGWALDSFYRYKEFRFCLAVDAIGFVYSGLQAYDLAYISATGKHLAQHHLRPYLNFSLDQMLSYLLISATSSAATRVGDWQMNWGKDKFPQMATASVALTVLAFLSFAVSSVISFYMLCTLKSL